MDLSHLLALLMQDEYVSCERISERLGVTRAAAQRAVEALRGQGHVIESARRKGYRLAPPENAVWPSLIRRTLSTRWAGGRIDYYDALPSTNRAAKLLGQDDPALAPHGTLVIADEQTAGRGRMTRSWQSRPGEGLLMSLLLRPAHLPPDRAAGLVQATALAVCEACRSFGADALVKWPNDIVCGGKKICGMLLEMSADMDSVHFAVVGAGLNVSGYPCAPDLPHAGCLNDACGRRIDRAEAAAAILNRFERLYDQWAENGPAAIDRPYRALCATLNSRVRVESLTETFEGTAVDLTADGSLVVETEDGTRTVRAGDVSVRGLMGYV